MATITTTHFTGKKEYTIPYRFTCNYCGQVNRKEAERSALAGSIERGKITSTDVRATMAENAIGKRLEEKIQEDINQCRQEIDDYAAALREGNPIRLVQGRFDIAYAHQIPSCFDGVCAACGRKQAWDLPSLLPKDMEDIPKRPKAEDPKWKSVLHIVGLICLLIIPLVILILLGATSLLPEAGTALIVGGVSLVAGIILLAITSPDTADEKKKDMEFLEQYLVEKLGSEPNLPENLPVIMIDERKE